MLQNVGEGGGMDCPLACRNLVVRVGGIDPFAPLVQLVPMVLERVVFVCTKDRQLIRKIY